MGMLIPMPVRIHAEVLGPEEISFYVACAEDFVVDGLPSWNPALPSLLTGERTSRVQLRSPVDVVQHAESSCTLIKHCVNIDLR